MTHAINPYVYAKLIANDGTPITSGEDAAGDVHLSVASIQDVLVDPNNTVVAGTDTLKAANSFTYTGTATTSLGIAGIQVSFFCDKTCIVYVEQSPDSTNWDLSDRFIYSASTTNFGVTVQAISSYFRVRITSTAETAAFRLMTAMCPVVEVVPRTLDLNGNFRVANAVDQDGFKSRNTPNDQLLVSELSRIVGAQFEGSTLDTNFWTTSVSTGTVALSNSNLTITSGTANGHYSRIYSVRRGRQIVGSTNKFRCHLRLADTGTANVKRRWGLAWGASMPTITDGAYFQLDGTTFSIVTLKGGSETTVSSGSFNGQLGYSYTPTTNNTVWEILPQNGGVSFYIGGVLLHKVTASTATWANTMNFHIYLDTANSGNSSAVAMECRNAGIMRMGQLTAAPIYRNITGNAAVYILKYGPGVLHRLIFNNSTGTSVKIFDNTTNAAPSMGVITTATAVQGSWGYDCPFFNGLTVETVGNGLDLTVVYE